MDGSESRIEGGEALRRPGARQRRGELTRQSILAAAAMEFATKGYEGASVRAIARAMGQEAALIQYHFGDKLGLWSAVLDHVLGRMNLEFEGMLARCDGRPPSELICNFVEYVTRQAAEDPVFVGIVSHARVERSAHAKAFQDRVTPAALAVMQLIRQAQAAGDFIAGDPNLLFYLMIGALLRLFMNGPELTELIGRSLTDSRLVDDQVELCVRLFMPTAHRGDDGAWRVGPAPAAASVRPALRPAAKPASSAGGQARPSTFFLVASIDTVMRRSLDERLTAMGLTQAQMIALIRIADERRLSSARLARTLEVTPQTVNLFVKALETKGLIQRQVDPASRRALQIEITASGAKVLDDLRRIVTDAEVGLLDGLTIEERTWLRTMLERILRRRRPQLLTDWAPLIGDR